jgi:signal transduction histidine kinase
MAVIGLLVLGELSLAALQRPATLGLRAGRRDGAMVVKWVQPGGLAWDAGVRPGAVVVALDGGPATARVDPMDVAAGSVVQVRAASGALLTASAVASPTLGSRAQRRAFLAIAACFILVGGSVFVLAADLLEATVVLGFSVAAATMLEAAIATRMGATWALALEFAALAAFGATAVLLFLVFPVNRLRARPGRWVAGGCLGTAAALIACYGWTITVDSAAYALLHPVLFVTLSADLLTASLLATLAYFTPSARRAQARRMIALLAVGTAVALAPFCLLSLLPYALGLGYQVSPDVAILSLGLLPLSLGGAVLSRQFLGIDRFLRRGLVAVVVWLALLGAYSFGIDALRRAVGTGLPNLASGLDATILRVAFVAGTFPFAQQWLRRWLERVLFRDTYDYAQTLQQLGAEIVGLVGVEAIATHVLARIGKTLDLRWAAIVIGTAPDVSAHRWRCSPVEDELLALLTSDLAKRPAAMPPRGQTYHVLSLVAEGTRMGLLVAGPKDHDVELLPEDEALLATLAPLVATALQNALRLRRLERQVAALGERERALAALSGRLLHAHEEERRRVALDLHDDPLARLTLLARELEAIPELPQTRRCRQAAQEANIALRAICMDLRPSVLDDLGLPAGLEWLANDVRARSDLVASVVIQAADGACFGRLDGDLETALYRLAQEALNNCLKHAVANEVEVRLWTDRRRVRLRVADDGRGFRAPHSQGPQPGLGLLGMRERLRPWGGAVTMERGQPRGTVVSAEVLLGEDDDGPA